MKGKFLAAISMVTALILGAGAPTHAFAYPSTEEQEEYASRGWFADFNSYEEQKEYLGEWNAELEAEGVVLLKNKDHALPLSRGSRVSLFGTQSYDPMYGGTGSAGATGDVQPVSLVEGLENEGFKLNPVIRPIYEAALTDYRAMVHTSGKMTVEAPPEILSGTEGSFYMYGDAAICTITRSGGETSDVGMGTGAYFAKDGGGAIDAGGYMYADEDAHYLQLTDNEKATIKYMGENFDKVIVLINSGNILEVKELEEDPNVSAILFIGQPGETGFNGVGKVLNGEISPSGKTVDLWASDFKHDPTFQNFGDNKQFGSELDNSLYREDGTVIETEGGYRGKNSHEVEYEEGIYIGYRYYETRAASYKKAIDRIGEKQYSGEKPGEQWYQDEVVYPFGFGLSYTTFTQTIDADSKETFEAAIEAADGLDDYADLQVTVKNTGAVSGKDVVELYVHAPYTEGQIEKSEVVLAGYAKTKLLAPGEQQTVTVSVRLADIASFDFDDANRNGYKGYELDAGNYEFRLQSDSHTVIDKFSATLTAKQLDNDGDADNNTLFSNEDENNSMIQNQYGGTMKLMSRANMEDTFPTYPTKEDRTFDDETFIKMLVSREKGESDPDVPTTRYTSSYKSTDDKVTDPWYKTEEDIPEGWTQAGSHTEGEKAKIPLSKMIGIDYQGTDALTAEDTDVAEFVGKTGAQAWEIFMNQLTYDEMKAYLSDGLYKTVANDFIGKEEGEDADGPAQIQNGFWYADGVILGSTWNVDIAYLYGVMVGNESMFLNVPGWYGPSMNIHRTPFAGRNFEYFSSDGVQGGRVAAAMVSGAQSKGVNCYIKHFGTNEQETDRNNLMTFSSEQAIREVFLKPFEYAVKEGHATGCMAAMSRIGIMYVDGSYPCLTMLLRKEWGFRGALNADHTTASANLNQRVGLNFPLGTYGGNNTIYGTWDKAAREGKGIVLGTNSKADATQYYWVRTRATEALWVAANTNYTETKMDKSAFVDLTGEKALTVSVGEKGSDYSVAVGADAIPKGVNVSYAITKGSAPYGTYLTPSGSFGGQFAREGTTELEVTAYINGWSPKTFKVTLIVKPLITLEGGFELEVGKPVDGVCIPQSPYAIGDADGSRNLGLHVFKFSGEVPGLTFGRTIPADTDGLDWGETDALDGSVYGTPTTPGTYTVSVTLDCRYWKAKETGNDIKDNFRSKKVNVELTFTVTGGTSESDIQFRVNDGKLQFCGEDEVWKDVTDGTAAGGKTITDVASFTDDTGSGYTVSFSDGTSIKIYNGADGAQGPQGEKGETGAQGPKGDKGDKGDAGANGSDGADGTDGKDAEGGCNGVIGTCGAIMAAVTLLGGAALVLRKKK